MKASIGIKNGIIISLLLWGLIVGCASVGKFTPQAASVATGAITTAQGLLHSLDSFYGDLVKLKIFPDYTTQATRALAMADQAAMILRAAIAGATVTDEQLNVAAGQVDGARAILRTVK